jgi:hypothetical protein
MRTRERQRNRRQQDTYMEVLPPHPRRYGVSLYELARPPEGGDDTGLVGQGDAASNAQTITTSSGGDFGGGGDDFGGGGQLTPQPSAATSVQPQNLYGNWTPALFMPHRRSIGGIIAEVTIEENGTDDVTITEHPVEQGAPIADHAFKRPSTVTIKAGWSVRGSYDLSAESGVYGLLLSWQAALRPFDVITGKRKYTNMLIERLSVITDEKSEYALMADIVCRQVIIVATASSNVQTASQSPSDQKEPEKTSQPETKGDQPTRDIGDGGMIEQSYPTTATPVTGPESPPEGGNDSVLQPEGQKVESTITGQPIGRAEGTDSPLIGPGQTGTGSTALPGNANETQLNEKGMTTRTDSSGNFLSVSAPLAPKQQRSSVWQRTSRSPHGQVVLSPSALRYLALSTR